MFTTYDPLGDVNASPIVGEADVAGLYQPGAAEAASDSSVSQVDNENTYDD